MAISEGDQMGIVGQEGFILVAIGQDGSEEVLMALTGEGAEDGIQDAARKAMSLGKAVLSGRSQGFVYPISEDESSES